MLYINNNKPPECGPLKIMSGLEAQWVKNGVTLRRHHNLEDRLLMSGDDPVKINIIDPKRSKFLEKNSNDINTIKGHRAYKDQQTCRLNGLHSINKCIE